MTATSVTIPDRYGDDVIISANSDDSTLFLEVTDSGLAARAVASLTPKKARKVAIALIEAAAVIESEDAE